MESNSVFVFGSNLAGRHGAGAAQFAVKFHGAIYGQGEGRQGNSYAIPTKDRQLQPLQPIEIEMYVKTFLDYARAHPEIQFLLTPIGCGLAGYSPEDIAPMFDGAPSNVVIPLVFLAVLGDQ